MAEKSLRRRIKKLKKPSDKVASIIADAGGKIVGRTRLQKMAYILELAGLGEGFNFNYKHYGPYSEDLADAARRASLLGKVSEETYTAAWGGVYSIYQANEDVSGTPNASRKKLLSYMVEANPVELELAATAAFLEISGEDDAWDAVKKRKEKKSTPERIHGAQKLYTSLRSVDVPKPLPKL